MSKEQEHYRLHSISNLLHVLRGKGFTLDQIIKYDDRKLRALAYDSDSLKPEFFIEYRRMPGVGFTLKELESFSADKIKALHRYADHLFTLKFTSEQLKKLDDQKINILGKYAEKLLALGFLQEKLACKYDAGKISTLGMYGEVLLQHYTVEQLGVWSVERISTIVEKVLSAPKDSSVSDAVLIESAGMGAVGEHND